MADFNTFIKLHRSILESAVFTDAEVLRLWIYLLCKASVDDRQIIMNGRVVNLSKGQLVTGRKALAANIGTTESKVYRSLKLLQELGCISIEVNSKFSLVTVENWGKFQGDAKKVNSKSTANQQQTDSTRTAGEQHTNTNNNDNNDNNDRMFFLIKQKFSFFFGREETEKERKALRELAELEGFDLQLFESALQVAVDADKRSASYVRGVYLNKMRELKQSKKKPAVDEGAAKRLVELNRQRRKENES